MPRPMRRARVMAPGLSQRLESVRKVIGSPSCMSSVELVFGWSEENVRFWMERRDREAFREETRHDDDAPWKVVEVDVLLSAAWMDATDSDLGSSADGTVGRGCEHSDEPSPPFADEIWRRRERAEAAIVW